MRLPLPSSRRRANDHLPKMLLVLDNRGGNCYTHAHGKSTERGTITMKTFFLFLILVLTSTVYARPRSAQAPPPPSPTPTCTHALCRVGGMIVFAAESAIDVV